jgi:hypothetical protein
MRIVIALFFLFLVTWTFGQSPNIKWTSTELDSAKTADTCSYLITEEKDAVMFLNLARLYPNKFKELELKNYFGTKKYGDYLKGSPYIITLENHLDSMKPLPRLIPNDTMSQNAACFANEMGISGYVGHERVHCDRNKYYTEMCSYGMDNGKDIIMQMLIDHNIESLGHRNNCLNYNYTKIGLSMHIHKEWGHCCVIELMK